MNQAQQMGWGLLIGLLAAIVSFSESAGAQTIEEGRSANVTSPVLSIGESDAATTVEEWLVQEEAYLAQSPTQITGIEISAAETGLEVVLETFFDPGRT